MASPSSGSDRSVDSLTSGSSSSGLAGGSLNIARVLLTVVAVCAIAGAAYFAYDFAVGGPATLYPVRGVVYLDGEPMPDGIVMSYHEGGEVGGIAQIGPDGSFELKTNLEPGICGGVHKLRVAWTDGKFPPFSYIPMKYTNLEETPFSVDVDSGTGDTPLKLELFGKREPPARPAGGGMRPPGGPPQRPEGDSPQDGTAAPAETSPAADSATPAETPKEQPAGSVPDDQP